MTTEIIPRQTLAMMADAYQTAQNEIGQAFDLLHAATNRLKLAFTQESYSPFELRIQTGYQTRGCETVAEVMPELKRQAWSVLVARMGLRHLMSVAECAEMDKQLQDAKGMPEITLPNLLAMLEGTMARVPDMLNKSVKEVFDYLRPSPSSWRFAEHKTTQASQYELQEKHILSGAVRYGYGHQWSTDHYREDMIRAIDNVFHALDGKGVVKSHRGPLVDAINACPHSAAKGETDYFRFKCFHNGNLHLEFKRADLVAKLNQVAGGMNLKPEN